AHTGPDGVSAAQEWEPDVVLCDIDLPGLDGFGIASALQHGEARLVAITAYGDKETRRRAAESGFDHFLISTGRPRNEASTLSRRWGATVQTARHFCIRAGSRPSPELRHKGMAN